MIHQIEQARSEEACEMTLLYSRGPVPRTQRLKQRRGDTLTYEKLLTLDTNTPTVA
jgi:negative regulator of sigma E activity